MLNKRNKKKLLSLIIFFIFIIFLSIIFLDRYLENSFLLITNRGYYIPKDSSKWTFKSTEMNLGSGEWWMYGEDNTFFYYNLGKRAIKINKVKANNIKNFNKFDIKTWKLNY